MPILKEYIAAESVDLIYLDPPFNSKRSYNVLFKDESGNKSKAQIAAFDDTWHWNITAEKLYSELVINAPDHVSKMIGAMREFIGVNPMMAYLVMMAVRLMELHRVLKPTGSLYLHCDPTASHYLKIVLDTIFGTENFKNEIIWHYRRWTGSATHFMKMHDIILFYAKDKTQTRFNVLFTPYTEKSLKRKQHYHTRIKGEDIYVTEIDEQGVKENDVWQIQLLNSQSKERLGYPTQKPLALLERIIMASSNPGDVVLDPFCGCGTTVAAAQKLNRKWIGIDITHLAISLQKYRLEEMFPGIKFELHGEPQTVSAADFLAKQDRFQFEWWALSLVKARPIGNKTGGKKGKKGADKGIDGVITFIDEAKGKPKRVLVQVKSGKVGSRDIRDLVGTVEREKAAIGIFITLNPPTKPMIIEATSAGFYESIAWGQSYSKIQIFTIEQLLSGANIHTPPAWGTFKQAQKVKLTEHQQLNSFD